MLKRLHHLPRDTRDTLFWLGVIVCVVLPQVGNLPGWCVLASAATLLWRATLAIRQQPLPSRAWVLCLLLGAVAGTALTFNTIVGSDAGVTLIVMLLALKTLELRARRDTFVVFFLCFFTMLTNFFYSQSLVTAAIMVLALWGLLTALINAHMPVGRPPLSVAARIAARMVALGTPIMLLGFMLFPRVAPLWGLPDDGLQGRSGLSNSMQVGTLASLALDDSIAMRVLFEGRPPPPSVMYYRGPVLTRFDGQTWQAPLAPVAAEPPPAVQVSGPPVAYQVTLEPSQRPWLLTLDMAVQPPTVAGMTPHMTPELQWRTDSPVTALTRYSATSYLTFTHGPQVMDASVWEALALPAGFNPRTLALAAQMRSDPTLAHAPAEQRVAAVLQRLRSGGYRYTLSPGVYGQHTADEFWFDKKEGFCEHMASSFVILMRALGVPARVVTGYQGGELNGVDGFWVVRQRDAHAWAEVWSAGKGWVRVDPTGAVVNWRVGAAERLRAPQNAVTRALLGTVSPRFALNLRALWDATNNRWNQWVLNYTQERQLNLLKHLGFSSPDWTDLGYLMIALVVAASLVGAAWTLWERRQHDPWLRLLQQARTRLQRAGVVVAPHSPPRSLAQQVAQNQQLSQLTLEQRAQWTQWLLRLEDYRYSARTDNRTSLVTLQKEFKLLPRPS